MIRNITLSAEETLIQKARMKAQSEHKSLNVLFREWMQKYAGEQNRSHNYRFLMRQLSSVDSGGKFTRDELNER